MKKNIETIGGSTFVMVAPGITKKKDMAMSKKKDKWDILAGMNGRNIDPTGERYE